MRKENIKIFIVDENDIFQKFLQIKLIQFGFTKNFFSLDPESTVQQFKLILPDLVIINLEFANENQIALVDEILKIKDIPIIFLTNDLSIEANKLAKGVSPRIILNKKFNDLDLLQNIELALMSLLRENSALIQKQNNLESDFIFTKQGENLIRIYYSNILWFQTFGGYVQLFTKDNKKSIINYSLAKLMEVLPQNDFIKVHQNHIVNKKYIRLFQLEENYIMVNEYRVEVSPKQKKELLKLINFI